jgi:hypothetical protein
MTAVSGRISTGENGGNGEAFAFQIEPPVFSRLSPVKVKIPGASSGAFDQDSSPVAGVADPGPASTRPATSKPKHLSAIGLVTAELRGIEPTGDK